VPKHAGTTTMNFSLWRLKKPYILHKHPSGTSYKTEYAKIRMSTELVLTREIIVVNCKSGVGLRPLACWDRGFESHRGHGCLSVVSVVFCQVEVSATDWSLVQRSPTDCGASLGVIKKPRKRGGYSPARGLQNTNPQWVVVPVEKKEIVRVVSNI